MAAGLFRVETGFSIDEEVYILYGADDPSSGAGIEAPAGSLYLRNAAGADGGELWIKIGDADTAWEKSGAGLTQEIEYIRAFIGKDAAGNEMPDYSSTFVVADNDSLETAIGKIDAEIGDAVTPNLRTNNPISDQAINRNIEALDDAIGTDADIVNTNYIQVSNTINANLSALDGQVKQNADDIASLQSGLHWIKSVRATTSDDISGNSGTSATFSDDNIGISYSVGDRIASSYDHKIYVVNSGTWTVASDGNLSSGDSFFSTYCFIFDSDASLQGPHAVSYNGTDFVKLADFDFEYANTIKIASGYTPSNGDVTTSDTIQSALEKIEGNQQDIQTTLGVSQGATDLGTFTGNTIQDNRTVKNALQDLETQVDTNILDISNLEAAVGSSTGTAGLTYTEQNYVTNNQSLKESVDALDIALGKVRIESSATGVTTEVTLDEVKVDDYDTVKWLVTAIEQGNPNRKTAWEVYAIHDGTDSADATKVDFTKYAKLRVNNRITGLKVLVDLNGSGTSQTMRLRVHSTDAVDVKAIRTAY